jgi:hypothetical protein
MLNKTTGRRVIFRCTETRVAKSYLQRSKSDLLNICAGYCKKSLVAETVVSTCLVYKKHDPV